MDKVMHRIIRTLFSAVALTLFVPPALGEARADAGETSRRIVSHEPIHTVPNGSIVDDQGDVWGPSGQQILSPGATCNPPPPILQNVGPTCGAPTLADRSTTKLAYTPRSPPLAFDGWAIASEALVTGTTFYDGIYAQWQVPQLPTTQTDGTYISLWDGLGDVLRADYPASPLLQPVLVFDGTNATEGWQMSALITIDDLPQEQSTQVQVNPGDVVAGAVYMYGLTSYIIEWADLTTGKGGSLFYYMTGPSGQYLFHFQAAYPGILEGHNVTTCGQWPDQDSIAFTDVALFTSIPAWFDVGGPCFGCNPDAGDLTCDAGIYYDDTCYHKDIAHIQAAGQTMDEAEDAGDAYCSYSVITVDAGWSGGLVVFGWTP
jgi:hypothetical protein